MWALDLGEDALLLREFAHRTMNEIAAASAALHLVQRARGPNARDRLLRQAMARLEGFAALNRLLATPLRGDVDLAETLDGLCHALVVARPATSSSTCTLDLPPTVIGAALARRLALVFAELVVNAMRHALDGRAGHLAVGLRRVCDDLVLTVADDGPGVRPSARTGTGLGRGIVAELVERMGGSVTIDTGVHGTAVRVIVPLPSQADHGDDGYAF